IALPFSRFRGPMRPGRNLYSNSVLALEAKTGKLIAWVQPLVGDFHDWDVAAGPALITAKGGKAMVAAGAKDGYVYFIDRSTVADRAAGRHRVERPRVPSRPRPRVRERDRV